MEVVDIVALRAQFLERLHEALRCVHARRCNPARTTQRSHALLPCSEAEEAFDREYDVCVTIQRVFRGWRVRSHLAEFRCVSPEAQSVMRE
jgi:hypothetical protein